MQDTIRHALDLAQGNLLRIEEGPGVLVTVTDGEVWLTEEREARDIVLRKGESFRLQQRGLALVYALQPSHMTLAAPRSRERAEPTATFRLVPAMQAA
jgi:nitroreductase